MKIRVLLSRFWHWWQWYWLYMFYRWRNAPFDIRPSSGKITIAYLRGLGLRNFLRFMSWALNTYLWFYIGRYLVSSYELVIDRNAWITLFGGFGGAYDTGYDRIWVFLNKYQGKIPNDWFIGYHHEILHKMLGHVAGVPASIMFDNISDSFFSEYIGANTHFFIAPTLTYDQWRYGIMRRMSVAGESEVFGG